MRAALLGTLLVAAMPAWAQIHALPKDHILRNGPGGTEEEAVQTPPPVNLRPTQLLRCPDGKGGFLMQDTPCRTAAESNGAAPAPVAEVVDLSALPPRPQVAEATPRPVEAFPCGSRSTSRTRQPIAASAVARLMQVVVLPTPPF